MSSHILVTPMEEIRRYAWSDKPRWCFKCRTRQQFEVVVTAVKRDSPFFGYYEPSHQVTCPNCKAIDGDVFPGWEREALYFD